MNPAVDVSHVKMGQIPALTASQQKAAKELKSACQDFESIFISMIFRQMMDSIPKNGESSASGSAIMNSLGDQAVARELSKQGGFGMADALYKEMLKLVLAQASTESATVPSK